MENINYERLGENIKKHRKLHGFTQETFAEKVSISAVFMSQIETGSRRPSLETVVNISKALGVSVDMLLFGGGHSSAELAGVGLTQEQFNVIFTAFAKYGTNEISAMIRAFMFLLDMDAETGS